MDEETLKGWVREALVVAYPNDTIREIDTYRRDVAGDFEDVARHVALQVLEDLENTADGCMGHQYGCDLTQKDSMSRNHYGEWDCNCVVGEIKEQIRRMKGEQQAT